MTGRFAFAEESHGTGILHVATVGLDGSDHRLLDRSASTSEGAEWIPGTDSLLFDSDRAGHVHLFSMNAAGGDVQQLTFGDNDEGYPSISPDGRAIALDTNGITLVDADGTHPRQIVPPAPPPGFDTSPAFSPDGTKVAFEQVLDFSKDHGRSAIFVVNIDGSGLHRLTSDWTTEPTKASWSQDGSRILFNDHRERVSKPKDIWVMNADGTGLQRLTSETPGSEARFPDVSPDGTQVAFVHYASGDDHDTIQVMNLDGSGRRTAWIAPSSFYLDGLAWGSRS